jgi:MFS family permease
LRIIVQQLIHTVNLWGAAIYFLGAILSDRFNARSLVIAITAPFGIAGYAILLAWDVSAGVQYFATFLIATSCFLCAGTNIAWMSGNCAPDGKKAASLGIQLTLTNIGGVVAGQIYQSEAAPKYVLGNAWSLASVAVVWIGCVVLRYIYLLRERRKQDMRESGEVDVPESWRATDRDVDFKYML